MGGACDGGAFVDSVFEQQMYGACLTCHFREETEEGLRCQVLDGRDELLECPELQEHIRYHGIKLYGLNKP